MSMRATREADLDEAEEEIVALVAEHEDGATEEDLREQFVDEDEWTEEEFERAVYGLITSGELVFARERFWTAEQMRVIVDDAVGPGSAADLIKAGPNPKVIVMTAEQRRETGPEELLRQMRRAKFVLDRETCPVKIRRPWANIELADGGSVWIQWDLPQ